MKTVIALSATAIVITLIALFAPERKLTATELIQIEIDCIGESISLLQGGHLKPNETHSYVRRCINR